MAYELAKKVVELPRTGKKVTMREPTVGDNMAVAEIENEAERSVALIANLTGMDRDEILALPLKDFEKLGEELADFL